MIDQHLIEFYSRYFYNLGLNISCMSDKTTLYNYREHNKLKAPCHEWKHLQHIKQPTHEVESYPWETSTGLGIILGYENLMAIDVDGCIDFNFIKFICKKLKVPYDYPWIFLSGSACGFHMLFFCEDAPINLQLPINDFDKKWQLGFDDTNAYYPKIYMGHYGNEYCCFYDKEILADFFNENFLLSNIFQKIEFKWKGQVVIPPSQHQSGLNYTFFNGIPKSLPLKLSFENIKELQELISFDKAHISQEFYRLHSNAPSDRQEDSDEHIEYQYLFLDTETNGLPKNFNLDYRELDNWPRLVQIAWVIADANLNLIKRESYIIKPEGFSIEIQNIDVHGINETIAHRIGFNIETVLINLADDLRNCSTIVCHNYFFDANVILSEMVRCNMDTCLFLSKKSICTMKSAVDFCKIGKIGKFKYPKLSELYFKLFGRQLNTIHNACYDAMATKICFEKLYNIEDEKIDFIS